MLVYFQMLETPEEKSKFEIIYRQNRDLMFWVANNILHHPQDAEDAVHQAFVKLAENIHKLGAPDDPATRSYMLTVVENKAIDLYRRKQAAPQQAYLDEVAGVHIPYDGGDELTACILQLPPRQQSIIILKYSYGYSLREIAKLLDITYANAQKLDQRAKNKLRALCREKGIEW